LPLIVLDEFADLAHTPPDLPRMQKYS